MNGPDTIHIILGGVAILACWVAANQVAEMGRRWNHWRRLLRARASNSRTRSSASSSISTSESRIRRKVDYLVDNGHEICNHTLYHARLDRARDDAQVQEFIGRGEDSIQVYLPENYDIVTFALPLGMWPKTRSLAWQGVYQGKPYEYRAVLEVSGDANESPFDTGFDPRSVNRFIVAPGRLERQLAAWERDPADRDRACSTGSARSSPGTIPSTSPSGSERTCPPCGVPASTGPSGRRSGS